MKKLSLLFASLFTFTVIEAQKLNEKDVPSLVKEGFHKKYAEASVKQWEKVKTNFEAAFTLNNIESSAIFDAQGNFKELEQALPKNELSFKILEYCKINYPGYKLEEAAVISTAANETFFEAELKKDKVKVELIFDKSGNFVRKG